MQLRHRCVLSLPLLCAPLVRAADGVAPSESPPVAPPAGEGQAHTGAANDVTPSESPPVAPAAGEGQAHTGAANGGREEHGQTAAEPEQHGGETGNTNTATTSTERRIEEPEQQQENDGAETVNLEEHHQDQEGTTPLPSSNEHSEAKSGEQEQDLADQGHVLPTEEQQQQDEGASTTSGTSTSATVLGDHDRVPTPPEPAKPPSSAAVPSPVPSSSDVAQKAAASTSQEEEEKTTIVPSEPQARSPSRSAPQATIATQETGVGPDDELPPSSTTNAGTVGPDDELPPSSTTNAGTDASTGNSIATDDGTQTPSEGAASSGASLDLKNAPISSFAFLSLLLLCGKCLRVMIKPLRDLYLPSSVVGGTFGYLLLLLANNVGPEGCVEEDHVNRYGFDDTSIDPDLRGQCKPGIHRVFSYISAYYTIGWGPQLPEVLISVIFAAVFIGVEVPPVKAIWEGSGPQIMYGQIVTHGLWFFGLLSGWVFGTLFLIFESQKWGSFWTGKQTWNYPDGQLPEGKSADWLPKCYGISMYLGFEGGHGTVAGLRDDFPKMQEWKEGFDVAIGMATTGLLGATIWGVMLINIASRKGWRAIETADKEQKNNQGASTDPLLLVGVYSPETRPPMAYETVVSDSIDTLTLHAALIGLACAFGYGLQKAMICIQVLGSDFGLYPAAATTIGENFPLFPLCMVGGILVDRVLRVIGYSMLIDHNCMQRVSGIALDYLITAVLCTMDLQAATGWPYATLTFIILNVVGFSWHFFCILVLAPKMLPDAWFERAIFEVGHSMGTTANGLILLKMVDPHSETAAGSAIAFKLFAHEPVMGVWVALISTCFKAPMSTKEGGFWVLVWAGLSGLVMAFWFALYWFYFKPKYKSGRILTDRETFMRQSFHNDAESARTEDFAQPNAVVRGEPMVSRSQSQSGHPEGGNPLLQVGEGDAESGAAGSTSSGNLLSQTKQVGSSTALGHLMAMSSQQLRRSQAVSQTWGYMDQTSRRSLEDGIFNGNQQAGGAAGNARDPRITVGMDDIEKGAFVPRADSGDLMVIQEEAGTEMSQMRSGV
ncbi:unnamed protein product [Amoebophrya sp. A25]|nr:unnamed protein product [Amoebophrya sp. A25]|eukprot:GSA25T00026254001.1